MRRAPTVVALSISLAVLGQGLLFGQNAKKQGGKPPSSPPPITAWATYEDSTTIDSAITGGPYEGEIGELMFTAVEEVALTFDCSLILVVDGPPFPGCEGAAASVTVMAAPGVRHMPTLTLTNPDCLEEGAIVGCDGFAKQHIIGWKVGKIQYSLQWVLSDGGQPPDYPRLECLETLGQPDDDRCIAATMDTTVGFYDSTVEAGKGSVRQTGPVAWLRAGPGSKLVGFYSVPFAMHVDPVPPSGGND